MFADISVRLEKTKAEVREQEGWGRRSAPRHDAHKDCASGRFPWFQVRARLEARERAVVGRMERDVETLEKDLEELRRRDQEISQVLQSGDGANLFQVKLGERFIQLRFSNSGKGAAELSLLVFFLTQAAPLLCVPVAAGWHRGGVASPTEAFGGARRALSHLRSRLEEVCREEVENISRAGAAGTRLRQKGMQMDEVG